MGFGTFRDWLDERQAGSVRKVEGFFTTIKGTSVHCNVLHFMHARLRVSRKAEPSGTVIVWRLDPSAKIPKY